MLPILPRHSVPKDKDLVLRRGNGVEYEDIGITGVDQRSRDALQAAADALATAQAYTDTEVAALETRTQTYADTAASSAKDAAIAASKTYTAEEIAALETRAQTYADAAASTAKQDAIDTAEDLVDVLRAGEFLCRRSVFALQNVWCFCWKKTTSLRVFKCRSCRSSLSFLLSVQRC